MADNDLKRYFTKYLRDYCKSNYPKGTECFICGSKEELNFHHYQTLSVLVNSWVKKNGLNITTAEEAYLHREDFEQEHQAELYDDAVTLCKEHHQKLHSIYGRNPALFTAKKQRNWVRIQREKCGLE